MTTVEGPRSGVVPFVPPPYPFARLAGLAEIAQRHEGGAVELSIGTPCDPPPPAAVEALGTSGTERGYPSSLGTPALREAAASWLNRRFAVEVAASGLIACIGTKELASSVPQWLRLRSPDRDTVLFPSIAWPTYEMGAVLSSCRAVPVRLTEHGLDLDSVHAEDVDRALCIWACSPGNPTGHLEDLERVANWGRQHGVPVLSDECYIEFTWSGQPRTILHSGHEGVLAVHSLSKRSNFAGMRIGFVAGDQELVRYLGEVRQHAGMMVPGPVQAAATVALADDQHVEDQRARYLDRLEFFAGALSAAGIGASVPGGGFYLWVDGRAVGSSGPDESPGWSLARLLAERAGVLVAPGDFYGEDGRDWARLAMVQPMERLQLAASRLAASGPSGAHGR